MFLSVVEEKYGSVAEPETEILDYEPRGRLEGITEGHRELRALLSEKAEGAEQQYREAAGEEDGLPNWEVTQLFFIIIAIRGIYN